MDESTKFIKLLDHMFKILTPREVKFLEDVFYLTANKNSQHGDKVRDLHDAWAEQDKDCVLVDNMTLLLMIMRLMCTEDLEERKSIYSAMSRFLLANELLEPHTGCTCKSDEVN